MKKFYLFMLLASFAMQAQIKFEHGYFIDNAGNKTECLIKNIDWKNNPETFIFKLTETSEILQNTIAVKEFEVGTYHYERYTVQIDRSNNNINQLSNSKEPEFKTETLFLRQLVKGNLNLYSYIDGNLIRFFYMQMPNNPMQLVYKKYTVKPSPEELTKQHGFNAAYISDVITKENKQFQMQLYTLMENKNYAREIFQKLEYSKKDLVKIFLKYNDDKEVTNYTESETKSKYNVKITAGLALTSVDIDSNTEGSWQFDHYQHKFGRATAFRAGIEGEWIMPFNRNKWSVFIEPNYVSFKKNDTNAGDSWSIQYSFIELPVGLRHYMYINNNSRFFVNYVFAAGFKIGDSFIKHKNIHDFDISSSSNSALGAGFAYSGFSIEARYNLDRGLITYGKWNANYNALNFIFSYKIL